MGDCAHARRERSMKDGSICLVHTSMGLENTFAANDASDELQSIQPKKRRTIYGTTYALRENDFHPLIWNFRTENHLRNSVRRKNRIGNIRRTRMNVYFLFRSDRLCSSSHIGPQKSLSIEIGVEHITQCLCFGIVTFSACFMYLDMSAT